MIVISPHLDDAVFSCGAMLSACPGSRVVTVFAGFPKEGTQLTDWDAQCGFRSAHEALTCRREEDAQALALLHAEAIWLPFVDCQYGQAMRPCDVGQALRPLLADLVGVNGRSAGQEVLFPMGLFHADHLLTHEAARDAVEALWGSHDLLVYEDALYRDKPGLLQSRLAALACEGWSMTPVLARHEDRGARCKATALACYRSQLGPLGPSAMGRLAQPERVWRMDKP